MAEYETFNKYQENAANNDVSYKLGALVSNTASGNGRESTAGYIPGRICRWKRKKQLFIIMKNGYWKTEGNKVSYCITIDKEQNWFRNRK